ncbi:hypothetical protein EYF80_050105 [Liparis tanakae]|uniref:Uncharacterized protein n=1 Tax=Liparis tanakae TaxID=230148 RepID=A0A4Z2FET9_9TELE|nr:hypothetical protein EYF80_050105 [Liparis tanakae]
MEAPLGFNQSEQVMLKPCSLVSRSGPPLLSSLKLVEDLAQFPAAPRGGLDSLEQHRLVTGGVRELIGSPKYPISAHPPSQKSSFIQQLDAEA